MNDYRIYQHIRYKTRRSKITKRALPTRLRTLRTLGIPHNRVKAVEGVPGIGGQGWVVDEGHQRGADFRFARAGVFLASFWCFFYARRSKRYRCRLAASRGRVLRTPGKYPKVIRRRR